MESNGVPGVMPGMASGMLGLEMPLHPNPHQQQPYAHHPQMVSFAAHGTNHPTQCQQSIKQNAYPYPTKGKQHQQAISDEDDPGFTGEDGGDGRKQVSPWQRVKWTDNMIRLLIMIVFYVGDDIVPEANNDPSATAKKKSGGLLQKKGKWKSVSRAMMEKGFYVSPQQCEDKFNDLNKRYKRVNDILGKGTACRVVENQNLLDTMDHLSPKMKEEARKLLNSKHLFFREMCAYHNSGGGGGGGSSGATGVHQSSDVAMESSHHQPQQHCFHSSENAAVIANSRSGINTDAFKMVKLGRHQEEDGDGEDEDVDEDEDDDDVDGDEDDDYGDEEDIQDGGAKDSNDASGGHEDDDDDDKFSSKKRQRRGMFPQLPLISPSIQQLRSELTSVLQDGTKSPWEQRQWMRSQWMQLEEQRVNFQIRAFKLEKQRLKWVKFSGKKERDMERMKLNNERLRLENERMALLLRQKELELFDLHQKHHTTNKRPDPSSITG